jgi:hypothetical protein
LGLIIPVPAQSITIAPHIENDGEALFFIGAIDLPALMFTQKTIQEMSYIVTGIQ